MTHTPLSSTACFAQSSVKALQLSKCHLFTFIHHTYPKSAFLVFWIIFEIIIDNFCLLRQQLAGQKRTEFVLQFPWPVVPRLWGPTWSSLVLLGLCLCPPGKPVGNSQWAMPSWEVSWWFPQSPHTSLWAGSSWRTGPSILLKRESPMTTTLLFFLIEEVLMQGIGCPALGNPSNLDGSSSTFSSPWFSDSRAS